jgi:hypothetical protein
VTQRTRKSARPGPPSVFNIEDANVLTARLASTAITASIIKIAIAEITG